mmetsp:Transcript_53130/g.78800  ORF Transcript_53130/g.78800 Transcript_53130/m.78800 type:complete len:344 (-) Transcript_53130:13196-14227(-)
MVSSTATVNATDRELSTNATCAMAMDLPATALTAPLTARDCAMVFSCTTSVAFAEDSAAAAQRTSALTEPSIAWASAMVPRKRIPAMFVPETALRAKMERPSAHTEQLIALASAMVVPRTTNAASVTKMDNRVPKTTAPMAPLIAWASVTGRTRRITAVFAAAVAALATLALAALLIAKELAVDLYSTMSAVCAVAMDQLALKTFVPTVLLTVMVNAMDRLNMTRAEFAMVMDRAASARMAKLTAWELATAGLLSTNAMFATVLGRCASSHSARTAPLIAKENVTAASWWTRATCAEAMAPPVAVATSTAMVSAVALLWWIRAMSVTDMARPVSTESSAQMVQ